MFKMVNVEDVMNLSVKNKFMLYGFDAVCAKVSKI